MVRRARRSQIQEPSASDRVKQTIEEAQVALREMLAEQAARDHRQAEEYTSEQALRVEAQALRDSLNHLEVQQPISLPPGLTLSLLTRWRRLVAKLILKALLVETFPRVCHGTTFHLWLFHMLDTF